MLDILTLVQVLEDKCASLRTLLTVVVNEPSTIRLADRLASYQRFVPRLRIRNLLLLIRLFPGRPISCFGSWLIQLIQVQMKLLIVLGFGNCLLLRQISLEHGRRVCLPVLYASVRSLI